VNDWVTDNIIEIFGAVAGIAYVILEIKRNILLWPLGVITSLVYIYVFGHSGFYANMGLQAYYLVISFYGWYKWHEAHKERSDAVPQKREGTHGVKRRSSAKAEELRAHKERSQSFSKGEGNIEETTGQTDIRRINGKTALFCLATALGLWGLLWFVLDRWTDSPVPLWDGLIASLSVVATWMLTRKYLEQWYVWIIANAIAMIVYLSSGMYPTAILFFVYFVMAIIGVMSWSRQGAKRRSPV